MGVPFVVVALLAKKLIGVGLYSSANKYGFHRVYRRLLEGIKRYDLPEQQELMIRKAIKESFRFPSSAHKALSQSEVSSFLIKHAEEILNQKNSPRFFHTFYDVISKPVAFGKSILDMLKK